MIKRILTNFGLPIVAGMFLIFAVASALNPPKSEKKEPLVPPPESPFASRIAGVGLVEPRTKIANVDTSISGVLKKIHVSENQEVKKGQSLFELDDRQAQAEVKLAETHLAIAQLHYDDLATSLKRLESVEAKLAISEEELSNRRFEVEKAKAEVARSAAALELAKTNLDLLTAKSPIDGTVLKINISLGEFISSARSTPPMILGDLNDLQVRASIDESDLIRFDPKAQAVGFLRGDSKSKVVLTFIRLEQYAIPKKNLSNETNEKIDTRIVDIVYSFDSSKIHIVPGQQLDVFISAASTSPADYQQQ